MHICTPKVLGFPLALAFRRSSRSRPDPVTRKRLPTIVLALQPCALALQCLGSKPRDCRELRWALERDNGAPDTFNQFVVELRCEALPLWPQVRRGALRGAASATSAATAPPRSARLSS